MKWMHLMLGLATAGLVAACGGGGGGDDTAASSDTLEAALQSNGRTSTMAGAAAAAGLGDALRGNQQYTLLMPTDEAMAPFAEELAELSRPENRDALRAYVQAHMVDGKKLAEELTRVTASDRAQPSSLTAGANAITITVKNILGDDIEIIVDGGSVTINGASFVSTNIVVGNGALHLFNAPIFRPSVFGIVRELRQTSTLEAAIRAADLRDALRAPGPLTLFAPTNAAFDNLLRELNLTAEQLLANKPLLTQVLTYHVLGTRVLARQIEDGATPTTLQGQAITLDTEQRPRRIQITDARGRTANVTFADIRARNGVVHLIDRVILPTDKDIVDIAAGNADFSILVAAVQAAGLVDTLKGPGPFTVFAPTNAAFTRLLADLNLSAAQLLANRPLLTQVLTYHVLASRSLASSLTDGLARATVQGQPLKFARTGFGLAIDDASGGRSNVILGNVQASNGVIHAIDRVLLPTDKDLVQLAVGTPQLSILVEAVLAANLKGVLSGPGPFTVFAPTNDAFASLLAELGVSKAALLSDTALLTKVLTYHVVSGQVLSSGISFGQPIATLQGQSFTIGRDLRITDQNNRHSRIVATDVAATNGVVHVIDRVILPR
jgi:transforming growth factor-beta-induced protein